MLSRLQKSSAFQFLLPICIFAAIPVGLWLMHPRPLAADSAAELISNARTQRQEVIMEELQLRVSRYNTTNDEIDARWKTLQQNLIDDGMSWQEAEAIMQIARTRLNGQKWPILAERGWINNQQVWVIIAGWPEGGSAWVDRPSADAKRKDDIRRYTHNVDVALISAQSPYSVIQ